MLVQSKLVHFRGAAELIPLFKDSEKAAPVNHVQCVFGDLSNQSASSFLFLVLFLSLLGGLQRI